MVALTALHWVLIVAAGSITIAGVSVGIWQAVVASTSNSTNVTNTVSITSTTKSTIAFATTFPTASTTLKSTTTTTVTSASTTTATSTIIVTTSTTTVPATTSRSSNTTVKPTTIAVTFGYEKCAQNMFILVNNAQFFKNSEGFSSVFNGPLVITQGLATRYDCCNSCFDNIYCFLFEYNGACLQYGYIGTSYNQTLVSGLLLVNSFFASGYYIG